MESSSVLWAGEPTIETHSLFVERDSARRFRHRNKLYYRFNHWPIWIFVFFIAPGPLVFDLFERGFDQRMTIYGLLVLVGTAIDYVVLLPALANTFGAGQGCAIRRPIAVAVGRAWLRFPNSAACTIATNAKQHNPLALSHL